MNIIERKTVDALTPTSVSILTRRVIVIDNQEQQVGDNHRCAYVNSTSSRTELINNEPEDVINSVLAIWGDTPTVSDEEEE